MGSIAPANRRGICANQREFSANYEKQGKMPQNTGLKER
jgi:hypothetical protein